MQAKIDGKNLVITIPLNETPQPSKSGNSLIIAGTGGFLPAGISLNGKPVKVSVNAIVK